MKSLDKSALLNKETGMPKDIAYFFALGEEIQKERRQIKLLYQDGELGNSFIEIHHGNPLSHIKGAHKVNPATDLVPLCANCPRMVHREWISYVKY